MTQMDIQAEKLSLIQWLAGINDNRIIKQFKTLQKSNEEQVETSLTSSEKSAIDQGLKSIADGKVHTHESVMQSTKDKYPNLFK
jgi:hypothetical protein